MIETLPADEIHRNAIRTGEAVDAALVKFLSRRSSMAV